MIASRWDVVVVGAGAAGLSAAREAARRGASTALVEQHRLGGDCTWTGCVPSKTLLAAAARGEPFPDAVAAVRSVVERIAANEDEAALKRDGIDLVRGQGVLRSPTELDVDGQVLRSRRIILSLGAGPAVPAIPGLTAIGYLTSDTVFDLQRLPASLTVLGGGPIGCELAQAFAQLGSQVTLLETEDRILPNEEPEASDAIAAALARHGVAVRSRSPVERIEPSGDAATLMLRGGERLTSDSLLVAVGRAPATRDARLEEIGVELDHRGFIRTDESLSTTVPGIWATGDATGRLLFTHAAARMGYIAACNALSPRRRLYRQRFDTSSIPWAIFTDPEVGRVGLTEADAARLGGRVAYLPMSEVDRAIIAGSTEGFVKLVAAPRRRLGWAGGGRLVGATIVAPTGGELIHEAALAIHTGMATGRLVQTVHAYPTWSIAVQQAAAQFFFDIEGRTARPASAIDRPA